ncbi:MAG: hypothetical protein ACYSWY_00875 [Planctomycetota bacterium]|jgi:hypothetical protein
MAIGCPFDVGKVPEVQWLASGDRIFTKDDVEEIRRLLWVKQKGPQLSKQLRAIKEKKQ